ncbi:MAG: hypothetical protein ACO3EF_03885 [Vulcanococcus sp.]
MRPQRPALLMLPLALAALAGCSGTPFGDQLSRSFSQPSAAPPAPARTTAPASGGTLSPATTPAGKPPAPAAAAPPAAPPRRPVAPVAPLTPAPYRVTIKLPAADPSSPAEAVTDALRAAGVAFEVETIERVPTGGEAPAAPVRTPAPPAR